MYMPVSRRRGAVALALVLFGLVSFAVYARSLMVVHAEADGGLRGGLLETECAFFNRSHSNTLETTYSAHIVYSDGSRMNVLGPTTAVFGPAEGTIVFPLLIIAPDAPLGEGLWVCEADSVVIDGNRPAGQRGLDADSATFEVGELIQP